MQKNLLLGGLFVIVGFVIGFFVANAVTKPGVQQAASVRRASDGTAGPLRPEQVGGELPPGHPEIGNAGSNSAAANSAEAQKAMDKADRSPKDFDAQMEAAEVFYGLQDYDKAALYLERAIGLRPKDVDALVMMGNTKYDDDDFAAAATYYERALAVKPDDPDVRTDLGNTFFNRQDYARAIAEYRKAVASDPNHANGWRNIAAAALNMKDKAAAGEALDRLAALSPQSPEVENLRKRLAEMP